MVWLRCCNHRGHDDPALNTPSQGNVVENDITVAGMVRDLVLTAAFGEWIHVDSYLRKYVGCHSLRSTLRHDSLWCCCRYGVFAINICMCPCGWNALHTAAHKGDDVMVRGLLNAGEAERYVFHSRSSLMT